MHLTLNAGYTERWAKRWHDITLKLRLDTTEKVEAYCNQIGMDLATMPWACARTRNPLTRGPRGCALNRAGPEDRVAARGQTVAVNLRRRDKEGVMKPMAGGTSEAWQERAGTRRDRGVDRGMRPTKRVMTSFSQLC
jgi:hypothetical protein